MAGKLNLWTYSFLKILITDYIILCFFSRFRIKWRASFKHFINKYPEAPPINSWCVDLILKNFRCHIFRSSDKALSSFWIHNAESKVSNDRVTIFINHDILRLQTISLWIKFSYSLKIILFLWISCKLKNRQAA